MNFKNYEENWLWVRFGFAIGYKHGKVDQKSAPVY